MNPKVSAIILNYNRWQDTIECIKSVLRSDYANYQVIVIDNDSPDNSMDFIKAWAEGRLESSVREGNPLRYLSYPPITKPIPYVYYTREQAEKGCEPDKEKQCADNSTFSIRYPLILIQTGSNLGFAAGNNAGIRYALNRDADYVFLLNNDAVVTQKAISEMVSEALKESHTGMVAPRIFNYYKPEMIDRLGLVMVKSGFAYDRKREDDGPLLCPSGCAALYSRAMLSATAYKGEYFDEDFFMYCEDSDLGLRAHIRGFGVAFSEKAVVFHKGRGKDSPVSYYLHRNTIWAIVKNFPLKLLIKNSLWILTVQIINLITCLNSTRKYAVIKGKLDGIKGIRRMWKKRLRCTNYNIPIDKRAHIRHR